jgi:signal transduction histidine kinase
MLGLGLIVYTRSLRAVEQLVSDQNARLAERAVESMEARAAVLESDLLLLAENAETQRWLAARAAHLPDDSAAREGERFLADAWERVGAGYAGLELADVDGRVMFGASREGGTLRGTSPTWRPGLSPMQRSVHELGTGRPLGTIRLQPVLEAMVPATVISGGFGERGIGMVVDRSSGRILWHPESSALPRQATDVLGANFDLATLTDARGSFRYRASDTLRIASYANLATLPWTVVMSGATSEFATPFARVGQSTLLLFIAVALLATLAFSTMLRRSTRNLEALTGAAEVVGQGNFSPSLPPTGADEVGRLSAAFGGMVRRVHEMVEEVRISRQMVVLGEFAAQLSHEIRNPLTSIKLNLQKLERAHRGDGDAETTARPLEIALREVDRLDGVVRGVLTLARQESTERKRASVHAVVVEAVEVVADQARVQSVRIERELNAPLDVILMDQSRIKGALLNLFINSLEAMPSGGTLRITSTTSGDSIQLRVADTGPGIPLDQRAAVFRPFSTTKEGGTGLGLPLARRTMEDHGGTIVIEENPDVPGACIVVSLPFAPPA